MGRRTIALLFVLAIDSVSRRAVLPAAAGAATAGLIVAVPALQAFARAESPGFGVIRDLHRLPRLGAATDDGKTIDAARYRGDGSLGIVIGNFANEMNGFDAAA